LFFTQYPDDAGEERLLLVGSVFLRPRRDLQMKVVDPIE
jgi:hypothetical protein